MHDLNPKFFDFSKTLLKASRDLFVPREPPNFRVIYDPGKGKCDISQTSPQEILIGVGEQSAEHPQPTDATGIILQHKGTDRHSVSEYVLHASDGEVEAWRQSLSHAITHISVPLRVGLDTARRSW
jgi:hypothetical protein